MEEKAVSRGFGSITLTINLDDPTSRPIPNITPNLTSDDLINAAVVFLIAAAQQEPMRLYQETHKRVQELEASLPVPFESPDLPGEGAGD